MKLSQIIIEHRRRLNISQREFSRRCELSNSYISFLENEKNPRTGKPVTPSIDQYKKIAQGLGITVHKLFEMLDKDAPVDISFPSHDDGQDADDIRTPEARILARGIDKLPREQREQALAVVRAMFVKYADYFEKENHDDT